MVSIDIAVGVGESVNAVDNLLMSKPLLMPEDVPPSLSLVDDRVSGCRPVPSCGLFAGQQHFLSSSHGLRPAFVWWAQLCCVLYLLLHFFVKLALASHSEHMANPSPVFFSSYI